VSAQADAFVAHAKDAGLAAGQVVRDRDAKFSNGFDAALGAGGARAIVAPLRSPNVNAYVERFMQAIQQECLDRFIAFGPEHMDHLVREYVEHYHNERPHQGKGNVPLTFDGREPAVVGEVVCRERLGGVPRHYYRDA
jgi:transposase InsO family protein